MLSRDVFEEALAEIKDAPFEDWRNFRRKVLEVAKKELEESEYSEICFDYEPVKSGKGGKVTGIRFFVKKNPKCIHHSDLQRMPSGEEEGEEIAPNVLAAKKTPVNEKLILEVADILEMNRSRFRRLRCCFRYPITSRM